MKRIFIVQFWELQLSQDIAEGFFGYYSSRHLPWSVTRLSIPLVRAFTKKPIYEWEMDGIIMPFTDADDPILAGLISRKKNTVITHYLADSLCFPQVDIDHVSVSQTAQKYLQACGYDAVLGVSDSPTKAHLQRFEAFQNEVNNNKFSLLVLTHGKNRMKRLVKELKTFTARHPNDRKAVFCSSDTVAGQIIDRLHEEGYRIPADIAILGCDNEKLISTHYNPPISSIQTDYYKVGYEAARQLDQLIAGPRGKSYEPVLIPPVRVIERLSTGLAHLHNPKLEQAILYLKQHAFEPVTITATARAAGMSVRLLQKLFRENFKTSPLEYVLQIRMNRAKELLQETDMSIDEIADSIGYARGHTLSKMFSKSTGQSPGAFRNQFRKR